MKSCSGEGDKQWQLEISSSRGAMDTVKGCKTDKAGAVVVGNHKVYKMVACTEEERDDWVRCIEEAIRDNPVQRIINEKKEAQSTCLRSQKKTDEETVPKIVISEA